MGTIRSGHPSHGLRSSLVREIFFKKSFQRFPVQTSAIFNRKSTRFAIDRQSINSFPADIYLNISLPLRVRLLNRFCGLRARLALWKLGRSWSRRLAFDERYKKLWPKRNFRFRGNLDALDKFEWGGAAEPSSPKFLVGARVNEEGQRWFPFHRLNAAISKLVHPCISILVIVFFLERKERKGKKRKEKERKGREGKKRDGEFH